METERFVGGLRIGSLYATIPLAELLVDDQRVALQLRWEWLRRFARIFFRFTDTTWEAPRPCVTAEATRLRMCPAVRLGAPGKPNAIFWCEAYTGRQVLATLQTPAA